MIIAVILADRTAPLVRDTLPYLLPLGNETVIEHVASTVLRGPFGATLVASAAAHSDELQDALHGFALQQVTLSPKAAGTHAAVAEALAAALAFRARWEKAMAAAALRFSSPRRSASEAGKSEEKGAAKVKAKGKARPDDEDDEHDHDDAHDDADWRKHRQSADVKVRGLARSFDRDGILLFRGERPAGVELQAQLVEAFGREGADKGAQARPFAQAVYQGARGYPVALSLEGAKEIAALLAKTDLQQWLLQNLARVQDVPVNDPGAVEDVFSEKSYEEVLARILKAK